MGDAGLTCKAGLARKPCSSGHRCGRGAPVPLLRGTNFPIQPYRWESKDAGRRGPDYANSAQAGYRPQRPSPLLRVTERAPDGESRGACRPGGEPQARSGLERFLNAPSLGSGGICLGLRLAKWKAHGEVCEGAWTATLLEVLPQGDVFGHLVEVLAGSGEAPIMLADLRPAKGQKGHSGGDCDVQVYAIAYSRGYPWCVCRLPPGGSTGAWGRGWSRRARAICTGTKKGENWHRH